MPDVEYGARRQHTSTSMNIRFERRRVLEDTRRRGLLYGLLGVLTLAGVGNRDDGTGHGRTDYGARLELIYKF